MNEQLYFTSPFGLERVRAEHRFVDGWGWAWAVSMYDGTHWQTVDSGYAKSDRRCLRRIAECLVTLAEYEDLDEWSEEPF